ncbi:phage tail assembly chaperone [Arsenicitalea aurantiaca]|uniref:Phage tail assembly chaperone n=1 Tax=Arsenicitalea aurantiaca TaxID=1783274 RepID=A0A433XAB6_9HYPH|nr:rcc01693 family protein [Arsenicitalea aurantiaca]RUT30994.1 phage tail assembly chaperone [Arsenicitalea aurantiaca]
MSAFPWAEAMRFGLGVLRLAPAQFWAMTPRELARAHEGVTGRGAGGGPLGRDGLQALMEAFPDEETR